MNGSPATADVGQPEESATALRLRDIFRECFGEPFEQFPRSLGPKDVRKWDSTRNVELLLRIEEAFELEFSGSELARMQNVGIICDTIDAKLKK